MIEERAWVVEAGEGFAWLQTERRTPCEACSLNKGCGSAALSRVLGRRRTRVRALTHIPLHPGDEVIVGIVENALLQGSLAVYLAPLLGLFLGAALGEAAFAARGEEMSILLGLLGLLAGLGWLGWFARGIRGDARFQPVVLRRLTPVDARPGAVPLP